MTSDDRPPMPAAPPPSSEPPAPASESIPPIPPLNEIVDRVPGAAPSEPTPEQPGGLILPSDLPTWAPPPAAVASAEPPADELPAEPLVDAVPAVDAAPAETPSSADAADEAGDTIPVSTFLSQLAEAHNRSAAATGEETIAASGGSFDHLILPPEQPAVGSAELPAAAEETQRGWADGGQPSGYSAPAGFTPPPAPGTPPPVPGFTPPAGFAPPAGFTPPPGFTPLAATPPAGSPEPFPGDDPTVVGGAAGLPPAPGGAHANPAPGGGRGRLAALIGGVVVLAALIVGAFFLFHSSAKKTPVAAPTPSAVVSVAPSAAVSPTAAAPSTPPASPTPDAALAATQAKALQSTVIKPLKSIITDDLHVANATDHCVGLAPNAAEFKAHAAERANLLAQLRKLDVTAMQDHQTWKGLLEQIQLTNIKFDQQLQAYATDLEKSCSPSTATKNKHYQQALALAKASGALQKKFLASYNPVAKLYHVPMQGEGNL